MFLKKGRLGVVLALAGLLVYLVVFWASPLPSLPAQSGALWRRFHLLAWILLPEELVASWCGEPPEFTLSDRLAPLALAGAIWLWGGSLGWLVLRGLGIQRECSPVEILCFSLATGLSLLSLGTLLAGLLGVLRWRIGFWLIWVITLSAFGYAVFPRLKNCPNFFKTCARFFVSQSRSLAKRSVKADKSVKDDGQGYRRKRSSDEPSLREETEGNSVPRGVSSSKPGNRSSPPSGSLPGMLAEKLVDLKSWVERTCLIGVAVFGAVILLGGVLPPIEFDVREYHLQVPKEFYLQGHIGFLPHNVYGNMPLGAEMWSLLAMCMAGDWWLGGLAGKLIIASFTLLVTVAVYAAGKRYFGSTAGALAAFGFASVPWNIQISTLGLIDVVWGGYAFLALYCLWLWQDRMSGAETSWNAVAGVASNPNGPAPRKNARFLWVVLAGFFAGSAAACKYPALLLVVIPAGVWAFWVAVWVVRPAASRTAFGLGSPGARSSSCTQGAERPLAFLVANLALFALAVFMACGPWLVKNWVLTGNPIYPLLFEIFGGATRDAELNRRWVLAHSPPGFSLAFLLKDICRIGWASEWISPLVWPLAIAGFSYAQACKLNDRRLNGRFMGLALWIIFWLVVWWAGTHRIDRFWVPALPGLCLLAGLAVLWEDVLWRRGLLIVVLVAGAWNLLVVTTVGGGYNRYFVSLETLRRSPERVDPWTLYFNTEPGVRKVLLIGAAQVYDYEVPIIYHTCFDPCIFEQLAAGRSAEQVHAALRAAGVSHIFVHWGEIQRYRSPGNYGFSAFIQPEVFQSLVDSGVLMALPVLEKHSKVAYRVAP